MLVGNRKATVMWFRRCTLFGENEEFVGRVRMHPVEVRWRFRCDKSVQLAKVSVMNDIIALCKIVNISLIGSRRLFLHNTLYGDGKFTVSCIARTIGNLSYVTHMTLWKKVSGESPAPACATIGPEGAEFTWRWWWCTVGQCAYPPCGRDSSLFSQLVGHYI